METWDRSEWSMFFWMAVFGPIFIFFAVPMAFSEFVLPILIKERGRIRTTSNLIEEESRQDELVRLGIINSNEDENHGG